MRRTLSALAAALLVVALAAPALAADKKPTNPPAAKMPATGNAHHGGPDRNDRDVSRHDRDDHRFGFFRHAHGPFAYGYPFFYGYPYDYCSP